MVLGPSCIPSKLDDITVAALGVAMQPCQPDGKDRIAEMELLRIAGNGSLLFPFALDANFQNSAWPQ